MSTSDLALRSANPYLLLTVLFVLMVIGDLALLPLFLAELAFGLPLAGVFLDERLALFHVVGIALILTGIGITTRLGRHPAPLLAGID